MSSVKSAFAQRNNNITQIVPLFVSVLNQDPLEPSGITNASVYQLDITDSQFKHGIYYVDMAGNDTEGDQLSYDGDFYPINPVLDPFTISTILFIVNVDTVASYYPGQELTIFFKNLPFERIEDLKDNPLVTIGIIKSDGIPLPYICSPPFPPFTGSDISPSVTFKSDASNFNVMSSGPAGWFGVPALAAILTAYQDAPL